MAISPTKQRATVGTYVFVHSYTELLLCVRQFSRYWGMNNGSNQVSALAVLTF